METDTVGHDEFDDLERRVEAIELAFRFGVSGIDRDAVSRALAWAGAFYEPPRWSTFTAEQVKAHEFAFILRTAANPVLGTVPVLSPADYFTREAFGKRDPHESAKFARSLAFLTWADFARSP
jgi:hypothetical protein